MATVTADVGSVVVLLPVDVPAGVVERTVQGASLSARKIHVGPEPSFQVRYPMVLPPEPLSLLVRERAAAATFLYTIPLHRLSSIHVALKAGIPVFEGLVISSLCRTGDAESRDERRDQCHGCLLHDESSCCGPGDISQP
jgi:hypothetical protein